MAWARPSRHRMQPPRGPRRVLWVVKVTMSEKGTGLGWAPPAISPAMWAASNSSSAPTESAILPQRLGVDHPRVGRGAGDDQLGPVLLGQVRQSLEVDALVALAHAVADEVVQTAAGVDRRTVGEMAALVQAHAEDGVARLEHGQVGGEVGIGARVGLDVGVLGAEELARPPPGEVLGPVDDRVPAVVALARVALRVLVGEHRTGRRHHRPRGEVLRGDQLEGGVLALFFVLDDGEKLCVGLHHYEPTLGPSQGPASWSHREPRLRRGRRGSRPPRCGPPAAPLAPPRCSRRRVEGGWSQFAAVEHQGDLGAEGLATPSAVVRPARRGGWRWWWRSGRSVAQMASGTGWAGQRMPIVASSSPRSAVQVGPPGQDEGERPGPIALHQKPAFGRALPCTAREPAPRRPRAPAARHAGAVPFSAKEPVGGPGMERVGGQTVDGVGRHPDDVAAGQGVHGQGRSQSLAGGHHGRSTVAMQTT